MNTIYVIPDIIFPFWFTDTLTRWHTVSGHNTEIIGLAIRGSVYPPSTQYW